MPNEWNFKKTFIDSIDLLVPKIHEPQQQDEQPQDKQADSIEPAVKSDNPMYPAY